MNKVVNTYWDNGRTFPVFTPAASSARRRGSARARSTAKQMTAVPHWFVFAVVVSLSAMVCITANIRAWTDMRKEYNRHQVLAAEIEQLTIENLTIQEEIQRLRHDPRTIEREARKLGLGRAGE